MRKKIRFYKELLVEILETLCTMCLYMEREGKRNRIEESQMMHSHFEMLKSYSDTLRMECWKK